METLNIQRPTLNFEFLGSHSRVNAAGFTLLPAAKGRRIRALLLSGFGVLRGCAAFLSTHTKSEKCAAADRGRGGRPASRSGAAAKERLASASGASTGAELGLGAPIRCWIVGATGFRQDLGEPNGLGELWKKMRELSAPDVCVLTPMAWNDDAEDLAAFIAYHSAPRATVFFYGYSYGVGRFFTRLARALKRLGIKISMAVTCDGIRRWRLLKPLSLRFFDLWVTLPVPANVLEVYAFRQSEDFLLRGHRLIAEDAGRTQIHDCELHGYDHYDIDEAQSFHRVALVEARDLIERTQTQTQTS